MEENAMLRKLLAIQGKLLEATTQKLEQLGEMGQVCGFCLFFCVWFLFFLAFV